jgi:hypothetical protein
MKGMTIACPCASADDLSFDRVSGRPVSISICRSAGERKQSTARPVVRAHDVRAPVYCTDCIYGDRLIAHAARVRRVQPRVYSARYCKNFKRITQSRPTSKVTYPTQHECASLASTPPACACGPWVARGPRRQKRDSARSFRTYLSSFSDYVCPITSRGEAPGK